MLTRLAPAAIAVALLAAARPARADAVTDFKNGTQVWLRTGTAEMNGDGGRTTGDALITKTGGTLDFTLRASDLGMPVSVSIRLRGASLGGGHVLYTFDDIYTPPISIGGGQVVSRLTGQVNAVITRLPGTAPPRIGNARLTLSGASYILAYGTWGTRTISIPQLDLIGGLPQPGLDAFVDNGERLVCSDTVETTQPLAVWLEDPAPIGGAVVELEHPFLGGARVQQSIIVREGRRSANVPVRVAPNFVGTVRVAAAASGIARNIDLSIRPRSECEAQPASRPSITKWVADVTAGCASCTDFVDLNNESEKLARINGRLKFVVGRSVIDLVQAFPSAASVGADAVNNDGTITGRITMNGIVQAYRANLNHGTPAPFFLGAMTPKGLNNYDVVVGYRTVSGATQAAYNSGSGDVPFSLQSPYGIASSRALAIADSGHVIGTYVDAAGVTRGFRWRAGVTSTLPAYGSRPAIPVAVNKKGQIAVNGANTAGQPLGAIVSPTGAITGLGLPSGYSTYEVKSINRYGAVAGVATTTVLGIVVQRAFVWRPGIGFTPLSNYVANLTATDALRITDANQVVVRGTYNGVTDLYLLTL